MRVSVSVRVRVSVRVSVRVRVRVRRPIAHVRVVRVTLLPAAVLADAVRAVAPRVAVLRLPRRPRAARAVAARVRPG